MVSDQTVDMVALIQTGYVPAAELAAANARAEAAETALAAALEREAVLTAALQQAVDWHDMNAQEYWLKYGDGDDGGIVPGRTALAAAASERQKDSR